VKYVESRIKMAITNHVVMMVPAKHFTPKTIFHPAYIVAQKWNVMKQARGVIIHKCTFH